MDKIIVIHYLLPISTILIFFPTCNSNQKSEQIKKQYRGINDNIGYLKINIIDRGRTTAFDSAATANIKLRGISQLPTSELNNFDISNQHEFTLDGISNIQNGKILPLRVGEYFAYLNIDDTTIVPFLISETTSKTITFGYQYEKQYSLFSTSYKIENYSEKYCKVSFLKIKCPKLKIEKNKITELKLKIDSSSRFDGKTTGMVWILTGLFAIDVSVRGISSIPPGIILGSIFFKKNVAFDINTIDASK